MRVCITIDVEQDCPPFMHTYRGIEEGMPKLLRLLNKKGVPATFFTTGVVAELYPKLMAEITSEGHELGCHGHTHARLDRLDGKEVRREIDLATNILRTFYPTVSFRAPNLKFPARYLKFLVDAGYKIDSTLAKHKNPFVRTAKINGLVRIPVSTTSLTIRIRPPLRNIFLRQLKDPVVIFAHPWEFVDFQHTPLRVDCRWRTGDEFLESFGQTIDFYKTGNAGFYKMEEMGSLCQQT